ncbi:carboxylate-amine ligase [Allonocardiopsis opalescens]|uniref:Putative glutamate--cysteine ligase 2 n=1 Tax=Allonocardiopsis opalescens TaxID=1144618 RepID=A0A2T0QAV0_9ACTN|nr:glutamate--cysteine ligase [Allonocardiopsis opalescens]PRY00999.1 carboxylate-amine ligase [Allonocardiopsis opalescens]
MVLTGPEERARPEEVGASGDMLTIGVEEEFLLVDQDGRLASDAPEVLREVSGGRAEMQQEIGRCMVEAASPVCEGTEQLLYQLRDARARLAATAAEQGLRLVASGTPVLAEEDFQPLSPNSRYHRMAEHFGAIVATGYTCGCHVHVAIPDRETGVQVSNHLRPWLPVLLALTANSPFNDGVDTAYSSWRQVLWSRWPSAAPPPMFASLDHYESSVAAMLEAQAMLDRGMIYWFTRLSERNPTLETRVCDVAGTPEEAALAAALVRGLVGAALDDIADGRPAPTVPGEVLEANLWRAARDGLEGSCLDPFGDSLIPVHTAVDRLVSRVRRLLDANGDRDFVDDTLNVLRRTGGGARRQRTAFARRGRLPDVVDHLAESTSAGLSPV